MQGVVCVNRTRRTKRTKRTKRTRRTLYFLVLWEEKRKMEGRSTVEEVEM
jgi:hypothetical protein